MREVGFKVNTGLKNIIGRELITNKIIAIYELIKNSYDADASEVEIRFLNNDGENYMLQIIDNGSGMSLEDITEKYLNVAYSSKKYSNNNSEKYDRIYSGAKGVGRFSCDRLGSGLRLLTKSSASKTVHELIIDWDKFENNPSVNFEEISVIYNENTDDLITGESGTIIEISNLREKWFTHDIIKLKSSLRKFINPFVVQEDFQITIHSDLHYIDNIEVNGEIRNDITSRLVLKTVKLNSHITQDGKYLVNELYDHNTKIYNATIDNPFKHLKNIAIEIYYLNRAAKTNFTRIMGTQPINYGSVFIYKNGFRVSPYGNAGSDFLNMDKRKAQGYNRYLGTRDSFGFIQILGENSGFIEASSRDGGFIEGPHTEELKDYFYRFCIGPLEDYVVKVINWGRNQADDSDLFLTLDNNSIVKAMDSVINRNRKFTNVEYNHDFLQKLQLANKKDNIRLNEIRRLLDESENSDVVRTFKKFSERSKNLESEVSELTAQNEDLKTEKTEVIKKTEELSQKVKYFEDKIHKSVEDFEFAIHSIKVHTETISTIIEDSLLENEDVRITKDDLAILHETNTRIRVLANLIEKGKKEFTTEDAISVNLIDYVKSYVERLYKSSKYEVFTSGEDYNELINAESFGVILDNLIDNSRKHNATKIYIQIVKNPHRLIYFDNGEGLNKAVSDSQVFELGYSSTGSSGIGMYNIKNIVDEMKGDITIDRHYNDGFKIVIEFKNEYRLQDIMD